MDIKIYSSEDTKKYVMDGIQIFSDSIKSKELDVAYLENGIIIPLQGLWDRKGIGGVIDEKGKIHDYCLRNYIYYTDNYVRKESPDNYYGANPDTDLNNVKYVDEEIIFLGIGFSQRDYGHTIYESLGRLWYLLDKDASKYKVGLISPPSKDCIDLLTLFGIMEQNIIAITEPTKYRNVIIPETSSAILFDINIKFKKIIDRISDKIEPYNFEKVYFSRNKLHYKRTLHEKPLENVFMNNGFKVFYPEELSVKEKIAIVKGCKYYAGFNGSNIVHSAFAKQGTNIICLLRCNNEPYHPVFNILNNTNIILVTSNDLSLPIGGGAGPFIICGNEYLFKFFDDYNFKYNKKSFLYNNYQILDYIFVWGQIFKEALVKDINVIEISNKQIADNIIKIYYNYMKENTLSKNTLFYIGITTEVGNVNFQNYFEIVVFGIRIIKINLNKYNILKKISNFIPIKKLREKFRNKVGINSAKATDSYKNYFISNILDK